jgi:hypothetical protein
MGTYRADLGARAKFGNGSTGWVLPSMYFRIRGWPVLITRL